MNSKNIAKDLVNNFYLDETFGIDTEVLKEKMKDSGFKKFDYFERVENAFLDEFQEIMGCDDDEKNSIFYDIFNNRIDELLNELMEE